MHIFAQGCALTLNHLILLQVNTSSISQHHSRNTSARSPCCDLTHRSSAVLSKNSHEEVSHTNKHQKGVEPVGKILHEPPLFDADTGNPLGKEQEDLCAGRSSPAFSFWPPSGQQRRGSMRTWVNVWPCNGNDELRGDLSEFLKPCSTHCSRNMCCLWQRLLRS